MLIAHSTKLGEILLEDGLISQQQLDEALQEQRAAGKRLGEVLFEKGILTDRQLLDALASRLKVHGVVLRHGLIDPKVVNLISKEDALRLLAIPMFLVEGCLTVGMTEPQSLPIIDYLADLAGCRINPVLVLESNLKEYIEKYNARHVEVSEFMASLDESDVEVVERETIDSQPVTELDISDGGSPIVNVVNLAIISAIRDGASDIHVEPDKKVSRIRYRIDGVLRELLTPPAELHAAIVSRIKVIGKMDIAEKRVPQEGRAHIVAEGREIDIRVSSMPTILGEKIVLRLLDKANLQLDLGMLGFDGRAQEVFRRMLSRPNGLILVTGPTGSGKTTTLYSALDLLRTKEKNIVTVEDPVEYQLDLINQIQVNEQVKLTFARALRSILRQDPDVIMVGEIRDEETARVAIQAALTGHLVLSTLHTNDSPGAVTRLQNMGVESYLIASAVLGVVAQRLARKICAKCKTTYYPPDQLLGELNLRGKGRQLFYRGNGCSECHESGFRGRVGIYEVLENTSQVREAVNRHATEAELRSVARGSGWTSLREEAVRIAERGLSSLEEVLRVTQNQEQEAK